MIGPPVRSIRLSPLSIRLSRPPSFCCLIFFSSFFFGGGECVRLVRCQLLAPSCQDACCSACKLTCGSTPPLPSFKGEIFYMQRTRFLPLLFLFVYVSVSDVVFSTSLRFHMYIQPLPSPTRPGYMRVFSASLADLPL